MDIGGRTSNQKVTQNVMRNSDNAISNSAAAVGLLSVFGRCAPMHGRMAGRVRIVKINGARFGRYYYKVHWILRMRGEGLIGGISRDHEPLVCCYLLGGELGEECKCERCMCDDRKRCVCVVLEKGV